MQRADQQTGNDLVAHAQQQSSIKHIVRKRNGRALRDGIAAEQAQFHARRTLGHTVAHGRHAASHLRGSAVAAGFVFQNVGVARIRRVGREHIVVRSDDSNVRPLFLHDAELVLSGQTSKSVRHIGAAHALGSGRARCHGIDLFEVFGACGATAFLNAASDLLQNGMNCGGHTLLSAATCTVRGKHVCTGYLSNLIATHALCISTKCQFDTKNSAQALQTVFLPSFWAVAVLQPDG